MLSLSHTHNPPSPFFSIMFANSKMISGFCVLFFMQEIMGELGTPVIPLSQIIKTTKGTNQSECTAQRLKLGKGPSFFLSPPPLHSDKRWVSKKQETDKLVVPQNQKHKSYSFEYFMPKDESHLFPSSVSPPFIILNRFLFEGEGYQVGDLLRKNSQQSGFGFLQREKGILM